MQFVATELAHAPTNAAHLRLYANKTQTQDHLAQANLAAAVDAQPDLEKHLEAHLPLPQTDEEIHALVSDPMMLGLLDAENNTLGTAAISVEPLLSAAAIDDVWLPLGECGAQVRIRLSAAAPLLDEDAREDTAVVEIKLAEMTNLPSSWLAEEGKSEEDHLFTYTAALQLTGTSTAFEFPGARLVVPLKPSEEGEAGAADAAAAADAAGGAESEEEDANEPPAAVPAPPPPPLTQHIRFDSTMKTYLGVAAFKLWRTAVAAGEFPVEVTIRRVLKDPEQFVDTNASMYRAVARPDLSVLREAEATRFTGACRLCQAESSEADAAQADVAHEPSKGKGAKKGKEPQPLPAEEVAEGEPHPFEASGTSISVDLALSTPITLRPVTPPPPLPKTTDLVPRRVLPALLPKTAAAEFEDQVKHVVEALVSEWCALFPKAKASVGADEDAEAASAKEQRRRELLFHLHESGKYFAFKEKLKRSVVKLARESLRRDSAKEPDAAEVARFHNELYVSLTMRMNRALDGVFQSKEEAPSAPAAPDVLNDASKSAAISELADEAEMLYDYARADELHKERVALYKDEADAWLAYGTFLMRAQQSARAAECTREALSIAPDHATAQLAHGCVLLSRGELEPAEVFLKAALDASPADVELWLLMGLLYERMDGRKRDVKVARARAEAFLQEGDTTVATAYERLGARLLVYSAAPLVERSLELAGPSSGATLSLAELHLQRGDAAASEAALLAAVEAAPKAYKGLLLSKLGHARLRQSKPDEARETYEAALAQLRDPWPVDVLVHLGRLALDAGDASRARFVFLHASRLQPSCSTWLGAGTACLQLGEVAEAEECLSEANVLNNRDAEVWVQLTLLCAREQRLPETEQALKFALRFHTDNAVVLGQIRDALLHTGSWELAETVQQRLQELAPGEAIP